MIKRLDFLHHPASNKPISHMFYMVLLLANMVLLTKRSLALSNPGCMPSSLLNTTLHSSARSSKLGKQLLSPPSKFSRVSKNLPQKAPCKDYNVLTAFTDGIFPNQVKSLIRR